MIALTIASWIGFLVTHNLVLACFAFYPRQIYGLQKLLLHQENLLYWDLRPDPPVHAGSVMPTQLRKLAGNKPGKSVWATLHSSKDTECTRQAVFLVAQNIRYKTKTSFLYGFQALCAAFDFSTEQIIILLLLASTKAIIQLVSKDPFVFDPGPESLKPALVHYVFI